MSPTDVSPTIISPITLRVTYKYNGQSYVVMWAESLTVTPSVVGEMIVSEMIVGELNATHSKSGVYTNHHMMN